MKLLLSNGDSINITKRNFLASGGEGDVYTKGQTAFKIYHDPKNMLPLGKINELKKISDPNIIRPQEICFSNSKKAIGYSMRFIPKTYPLVQVFTKAFRERNGLDHNKMQSLIKSLYSRVQSVHKAKILIVDLNEMNFLVSNKFDDIYGIDTDSYQTPNYPATAIMESIRDRHSKTFSENTDWFAYAILSFIMFTGIHPYKGKHPSIKSIDDRMKQNVSVLNKEVRVPHVCYDFKVIPKAYMDWYQAVFQEGKRCLPPIDFNNAVIKPNIRKIIGSDNFIIDEVAIANGDIVSLHSHGSNRILTSTHFSGKVGVNFKILHPIVAFKTDIEGVPILAKITDGKLLLLNANTKRAFDIDLNADELMISNQSSGMCRLYVKSEGHILHVDFIGKKLIPSFKIVANVLNQATKMFEGVFVQELLGETYVSFFNDSDNHSQHHLKELDGYRVIDAKYDNKVLMIAAVHIKSGRVDRLIFRFDNDKFDLRKEKNSSLINFVTLDSGITVCINDSEEIEAFSNKLNSGIKIIKDPIIGGDMMLHRIGGQAYFSRDNKLFTIKMKV